MIAAAVTEVVPIETDADGVIRVGKARVTLDSLITAVNDGATAEEIAQQYHAVSLADVYAVIAYYLNRRSEVAPYLGGAATTRRTSTHRE